MEVVAEGVETRESLECLGRMGCERAQGHWHSPALPLADFMAWLQQQNSEGQDAP